LSCLKAPCPITRCCISRSPGLKLTPAALTFFAHSGWPDSRKAAPSARARARCCWHKTAPNSLWLRSTRRFSPIQQTYRHGVFDSRSWTRRPDDSFIGCKRLTNYTVDSAASLKCDMLVQWQCGRIQPRQHINPAKSSGAIS
jgi:hypothetical protein